MLRPQRFHVGQHVGLGDHCRVRGSGQELCQSIRAIKDMGMPLIVIDQDVAFLTALIDRLHLFDHGRISRVLGRSEIPDHATLMSMLFGAAVA